MNIGFVSTWFERGAAYVTKSYINLLKTKHSVFVYARGGENYGKDDPNWDFPYVTWAPRLLGTNINYFHFKKWIQQNNLDTIFFNEQHQIEIVYKIKKKFPDLKLGTYVDFYKEDTVKEFNLFDFLICNTRRHAFVFQNHLQSYYVPWGTDINVFKPIDAPNKDRELTFYHSAGMSKRKGTKFVIEAFINGAIYKDARLIIHTQKSFKENFGYNRKNLKKYNIEIIEKTVSAPGLYYLGDVYVYPTMLDGLGLTIYEALSSGLPVITTNHPPMNEVINESTGRLVDVDYFRSRADAYYWPLSIVNESSLINAMKYYCENKEQIPMMKKRARKEALEHWNWSDRREKIIEIFEESSVIVKEPNIKYISEKTIADRLKVRLGSSYIYVFIKSVIHLFR